MILVIAQHISLTMLQIESSDAENPLEDMARQQELLRTANTVQVKGDDKYTRSVQCV
jgi:hypothetical protein